HLHSATVHVAGGVILDHTGVKEMDGAAWCEYHGVKVVDGIATVFKAVDASWTTERGTSYAPGTLPSCGDWDDTDSCGGGLHFGPTPAHALAYNRDAVKFLACGVDVSTLRPINGHPTDTAKCKAPRVVRACVEVDIDGKAVSA